MIERGNGRKIYVAGPMQGIKDFNFPAFYRAAGMLREYGWVVFSPAERDNELHGHDIAKSETGNIADANAKGFSLRDAMRDDLTWICLEADAIYLLRGWEYSSGALAEWATARCLKLLFFYET